MSLLVCFCCLLPASCDTAPRPGVCHLCAGQVPGSGGYWTSDLPEWLHLLPPPPVLLCRWKGLPQPWEASWPFSFPPPRGFSGSKACGCHRPFPLPCAAASVPASPSTPTHKSPWFLYLPSPPSHPGPRLLPTSPEPPSNSCHSPAPVSPTAPYSARRKSTGLRAQGSLTSHAPHAGSSLSPQATPRSFTGLLEPLDCFFSYPLSWQGLLSKPHHHLLN